MIRLIMFDLDGTLLDTVDDICDSMNFALASFQLPLITRHECQYMLGSGVDVLVQKAIRDQPYHQEVKSCYLEKYQELQHQKTKPYPSIIDVLNILKERHIPMAVFSNKPHHDTVPIIQHYFGSNFFDVVLGKKPENKPKPSIDGCLEIQNQLNVHDHILYVGDTNIDMETATNAGYYRVAVSWGFRSKEELDHYDRIIDSPFELLDIVEELS